MMAIQRLALAPDFAPTMPCAVCGAPCRLMRHEFFEGSPETPKRRWSYDAPLYHKANATGTACEVPFCGARCACSFLTDGVAPEGS